MLKITIFITSILIILGGFTAWAEEVPSLFDRLAHNGANRGGFVQIEEFAKNNQIVHNEIAMKMASENCAEDVQRVECDDNGRVVRIVYADGSVVNQSYKIDDAGQIRACILESDNVVIVIKDDPQNEDGGISIEVSLKETEENGATRFFGDNGTTGQNKDGFIGGTNDDLGYSDLYGDGATDRGQNNDTEAIERMTDENDIDSHILSRDGQIDSLCFAAGYNGTNKKAKYRPRPTIRARYMPKNPVVVYYPRKKINLKEMAQKPITFNFKMIKKAISDTSALKAKALKEYEMKTKIYYDKVGDALLKAGLGANFHTKQHRTEQERRTAVDKAVEDARMIARGGESNAAIQELLRLEQSLRDIILNPARQIYEAKLQAAKAQIDKAINNMIASKLAVYLNANEKKIEAIVNLQDESSQ